MAKATPTTPLTVAAANASPNLLLTRATAS
jgi:hypothetical protein